MCAMMCLITVGKYCCGICWVKRVGVIGREWSPRKGHDASFDTQTSTHPDESPLLPGMPKLSMEGVESRGMVKGTGSTGQETTETWDKNSKSTEDGNGRSVGTGKASAAPLCPASCSFRRDKSTEEHWSISLSYSGAFSVHSHLAHLLFFRATIFTQALSGARVVHSAQLTLCTGLYMLI